MLWRFLLVISPRFFLQSPRKRRGRFQFLLLEIFLKSWKPVYGDIILLTLLIEYGILWYSVESLFKSFPLIYLFFKMTLIWSINPYCLVYNKCYIECRKFLSHLIFYIILSNYAIHNYIFHHSLFNWTVCLKHPVYLLQTLKLSWLRALDVAEFLIFPTFSFRISRINIRYAFRPEISSSCSVFVHSLFRLMKPLFFTIEHISGYFWAFVFRLGNYSYCLRIMVSL